MDTLVEGSEEYCYEVEHKLRPRFGIGYNCACGGATPNMSGMKHTEEAKRKISEAFKGDKHPLYGKPVSEESKLKMSLSQRGEKGNFYGKKLSEETKAKIAAWRASNPHAMLGRDPWEMPNCNKEVWASSTLVFDYMYRNPDHGVRKVSKNFGAKDSVYTSMFKKIKSGWNPSKDPAYLSWLEEHKQKECNGT